MITTKEATKLQKGDYVWIINKLMHTCYINKEYQARNNYKKYQVFNICYVIKYFISNIEIKYLNKYSYYNIKLKGTDQYKGTYQYLNIPKNFPIKDQKNCFLFENQKNCFLFPVTGNETELQLQIKEIIYKENLKNT